MTRSLATTIRRTGLVLAVAALGTVAAGSALAGTDSGLNLPPQSAIKASSANWAAKAKLLDVNGRPVPETRVSTQISSSGLDWSDFGIGAGAMLGLLLLGTGLAAAVHFSRRSSVRPRPAS